VKPAQTWLVYTLLRLGVFAVTLVVLIALQITPWVATLIGAVISLCVSIIFLRKPREAASMTLYEARNNRHQASRPAAPTSEDEDVEDDAVDNAK
jgi:L-lactate permease